jgi:hypothetical protein
MRNIFFALAFFAAYTTNAQVKFKIQLLNDQKTYQVSMLPEANWASPLNLTGTAQITLVVPNGNFEPKNVQNLVSGVEFEFNSRTDAPAENTLSDYVSVGLKTLGTGNLKYQAGVEVPLFTFQNAMACAGKVSLLNHNTDLFFKNKSRKANIGNYLSVLGANGDAYTGIIGSGEVVCSGILSTDFAGNGSKFSVSPNPFTTQLNFVAEFQTSAANAQIKVTDALGIEVYVQEFQAAGGKTALQLDLPNLVPGVYTLSVQKGDQFVFSKKVVKVDF